MIILRQFANIRRHGVVMAQMNMIQAIKDAMRVELKEILMSFCSAKTSVM